MQALAWVIGPQRQRVVSTATVAANCDSASDLRLARPDWSGLLRRAGGGDQAALAQLYDETSHLVFGLALRILGDRDTAEDVSIEVYAQAWREAKSYDPRRGTPCAWLLTMARSRAIDLLRIRKRDRSTDPIESADHVHSDKPSPEEATADAERHRFVRRALSSLKTDQREAIELAYFSGLSHAEIAARLGQPLGTIKTRIRLGMMQLRGLLDHLVSAPVAATEETP